MKNIPTPEANKLMLDGAIALAQVEQNGMLIDVPYLDRTIKKVEKRIKYLIEKLKESEEYRIWKRIYGSKFKWDSGSQLGRVLFKEMGHVSKSQTKKSKKPSTDQAALEKLDIPFVKKYLEIKKLTKLKNTYLIGIRREVVDGILRPFFDLHIPITYRSGSSNPNFQNIPIRDPIIGKLIRRAFIPRPDHVLVEVDYSAQEFKIAASFWNDPAMIEYASDTTKDIHRDMAAFCYMLNGDNVSKDARFYTKNQFVFPQLYGSWHKPCAKNLWSAMIEMKLKAKDGNDIWEDLQEQGINGPDDYIGHIKGVEETFNDMFPVYSENKQELWEDYLKKGYVQFLTGFIYQGVYTRNQIYNTVIQGPAFHTLLWSLIRLVKKMRKKKMRSMVIAEIHDSILADVHKDELDDYLVMVKKIMTVDVRKHWPWIKTPLEIEVETSSTNWYEKKELVL